jgi:hypothetical protein
LGWNYDWHYCWVSVAWVGGACHEEALKIHCGASDSPANSISTSSFYNPLIAHLWRGGVHVKQLNTRFSIRCLLLWQEGRKSRWYIALYKGVVVSDQGRQNQGLLPAMYKDF